ncbi:MAG TPA: MBL fold metallo-hydrolase [Candidatus Limnocylindrales bacterium]|nr:MBL fold metallo-hydrolase [Candidatus Limnocylindrales bacterium]
MTPAPAATVVLLRPGPGGPEVLLTHRPTTMAFAGGMHVFPGGQVDSADGDVRLLARSARGQREAAQALGDNVEPSEALALHMAAIRELFEEAGVLLADETGDAVARLATARTRLLGGAGLADALDGFDLQLRTDLLAPIGHWTTPPFMPRRFSTWFFAADLPRAAEVSFEGDEVMAHRWVTPATALDQLATGEIEMWVPTSSVLQRLVATGAANAAELGARLAPGRTASPRILEESPAIVRFAFGAAGALPGRTGTTTIHGRHELVLVDPGDPSDPALDAIGDAVRRRDGTIRAIVLTATDPDHAAASEAVAIPLGIPTLVAPGAGRHLPYLTRELADGERLPADVELRIRLGSPGSGLLEIVRGSAGE